MLLDYVFISPDIFNEITNVSIGDYHNNFSDHLPIDIDLRIRVSSIRSESKASVGSSSSILWNKLSQSDLACYRSSMEIALDHVEIPPSVLHGQCLCDNNLHKYDIELYFNQIVNAIHQADATLPKSVFRALKPFWSSELSLLKQQSYTHHKNWISGGKPTSGLLHTNYVESRANYRRMLRHEKRKNVEVSNAKLYDSLVDKDSIKFWKLWNSLSQSRDPLPPQIDGFTRENDITNQFANVFSGIYKNNDAVSHASLKSEFDSIFPTYYASHIFDNISQYYFSWQDMIDMTKKLKAGKAYVGFVKAEHILHGSPQLLIHLHILFNAMLQHSFIPSTLLRGNITPLVKDRDGVLSDSANYRAITLSSLFIQMYEMLQKAKFGYFLPRSDLQFGFKPRISTNHAIYSLKTTVNHFITGGSRVFLAFLDCSKAFDRISHWGLFIKLIKQNVPLCFLLSVMFLYLNMSCSVKWKTEMSESFEIPTGTKQGGILSPDFFAMYIHDLIDLLKASGFGCHVIRIFIACLFFADDIVLLSPSRRGLQSLLDICVAYCKKYCLDFNVKKSKIMVVGKNLSDTVNPILLGDAPLDFVSQYKYLGVTVQAGRELTFSVVDVLRSFHRAANSILRSQVKPHNTILMKLLYTNCVPIITYACAVREFSASDMRRCHVAVNNAIRFIFSFGTWQSIRHIRIEHGYKSIYEIFSIAKTKFLVTAKASYNTIVSHLASTINEQSVE